MKRRAVVILTPLLATATLAYAAGTPVVWAQNAAPSTLHVYTDLVEIPALVLDEDLKPVPPVRREQFAISLDRGPAFHPTAMRTQGDDPIALAVLLDARGDQDDLLQAFGKALPKLVPQYLHATDHVSIYAVDCAVAGGGEEIAADASALKAGVAAVLGSPGLHGAGVYGKAHHGACGSSIRLWDAVAQVTGTLGARAGRRVLLVVSKGTDGGSASGFAEAVNFAESRSVAIFGLRYSQSHHAKDDSQVRFTGTSLSVRADPVPVAGQDSDLFDQMCESSGGIAFNLWDPEVTRRSPDVTRPLQNLVTMLRGRYILDFPRPDAHKTGLHTIDISVPRTHDVVRTTGVTYSSPDPALLADPSTVPSSPSPAGYGNRRPLQPKP